MACLIFWKKFHFAYSAHFYNKLGIFELRLKTLTARSLQARAL